MSLGPCTCECCEKHKQSFEEDEATVRRIVLEVLEEALRDNSWWKTRWKEASEDMRSPGQGWEAFRKALARNIGIKLDG